MVPSPLEPRALAMRMRDLGTGCTRPDISWCGERRTQRARLGSEQNRSSNKRRSDRTGSICDHQYDVTDVAHPQALRLRRTASRLRGLTAHNIRNQRLSRSINTTEIPLTTAASYKSRMGAVAGGQWPSPRFPSPLIEPDVRRYRIRLSDWLHREAHDGAGNGRRSRRRSPRSP
jgi:hypothetical protein